MANRSTTALVAIDEVHRRYLETKCDKDRIYIAEYYRSTALVVARRMSRRQREKDDVVQVAMIGLLNAIDRFDPERGVLFTTYAWRVIEGEIKRYFRDSTWAVHVPRSLQERSITISGAAEVLAHELARAPTVAELAKRVGVSEEEVLEALEMQRTSSPANLDIVEDEEGPWTSNVVGVDDAGFRHVDERAHLRGLLSHLNQREQTVLRLRFVDQLSQSVIAEQLGVSQMHVSRLLAKSLATLRVIADSQARN